MLVVVVLTLSTLGVDTSILVTVLTIVVAAFEVALSLALGLGSRQLIQEILSSYYVRDYFPEGQAVRFGDVEGNVTRIGTVNTVISTADATVTVSNTTLLHSLVRGPQAPDTPASNAAPPDPASIT